MNFVDEKHIARFQICHLRDEVAGYLNRGTSCRVQIRVHFLRNNVRQGCLA